MAGDRGGGGPGIHCDDNVCIPFHGSQRCDSDGGSRVDNSFHGSRSRVVGSPENFLGELFRRTFELGVGSPENFIGELLRSE